MKFRINIERCLIPGVSFIALIGCLFLICFFGGLFLYSQFPICNIIPDDIACTLVFVVSVFLTFFFSYLDEWRHGDTQILQAELLDDCLILTQERHCWNIPLTEIREVMMVMRFDRIYVEKGKYKVVIKRKKHRSLTFMTTDKEYDLHSDFEDTELSKLYYALRAKGIYCC